MKMKIGVISSLPDVESIYGNTVSDLECQLFFRTGCLTAALLLALELQNTDEVDAIILIGIPTETMGGRITVPVYPIYPDNYDIMCAFYQARAYGTKLAFTEIGYTTKYYDLDHIIAMSGFDVSCYRFTVRDLIRPTVDQVIADNRECLVTMGGYSYEYAMELNFPVVLVIPQKRSFLFAIELIRRFFLAKQAEQEKFCWLRAVMDHTAEGILVLDHREQVIVINSAMSRYLQIQQDDILGQFVDDISRTRPLFQQFTSTPGNYETIHTSQGEYIIKKYLQYDGDTFLGTLISAHLVKDIQRMEMDARRKIHEQGFVARHTFADIKGSSRMFTKLKDRAQGYARSHSNILLYGQSGSGKEIFAQSIHNASPLAGGPFIAINCTTLTESLLESELFGYEDGAFTDARKGGKSGLFEMAHGGTLFLDEIGDMPFDTQVKLLRVLQERTVRRTGGAKNIPIHVRFIFATNHDLAADVAAGTFRQDLYYRINVLPLRLPPLCEHPEDLREIALDAVKHLSARNGRMFTLSEAGIQAMAGYHWPGNIRELHNFLERAIVLDYQKDEQIRELLLEFGSGQEPVTGSSNTMNGESLTLCIDSLRNMENAIIKTLYQRYDKDKKQVEQVLDISTSSLYRRLKESGRRQTYEQRSVYIRGTCHEAPALPDSPR